MHYDDPARPVSDVGATPTPLQVNGSPLPVITLIRPMCSEGPLGDDRWGWLCCIHAHKAQNRFGTYYAWIGDLGEFQRDFFEDPEAALLKYFKYDGPHWEPTEQAPKGPVNKGTIEEDLFA